MIYISKSETPSFWEDYKKRNPRIHYDQLQDSDEGIAVRRQLREHLVHRQHGLCAYCCRRITPENSLNEHIRPKGLPAYSKYSMDYNNLLASCRSEGGELTCSDSKKNHYNDDLFVSPLEEKCEAYFDYYPNGEVVSGSPEGQYTIDLLNLNSYKLKTARMATLKACDSYHDPEMVRSIYFEPDENGLLEPYIDIVRRFYQEDAE